jgi:fengycin family lipopeptide synthetase D
MAIFVTGSTGYLGSYLAAGLLTEHRDKLNLLIRAKTEQEARGRLWTSLQLHFEFPEFAEYLSTRVRIFRGDLTGERFGLSDDEYHVLVDTTDSVIHCAASLNRKSEKQCLNVNLRGTLEVIQLARRAQNRNGLRRYSHVSTVAVAGKRKNEIITEDASIDWSRSDYDPYARTKKFCEHMANQLLPDVPKTIFRPAIILGDSRRPETSQFDMVQAFHVLAQMPVLPLRPHDKIDIVPANYVGKAIVTIHKKEAPVHGIYHLSSGTGSQTYHELTDAISQAGGMLKPMFLPSLGGPFSSTVNWVANRRGAAGYGASLLKVFWPYLDWNTVFDNSRVVAELGEAPAKFSTYAYPLLRFSRANKFRYPEKPWPSDTSAEKIAVSGRIGA